MQTSYKSKGVIQTSLKLVRIKYHNEDHSRLQKLVLFLMLVSNTNLAVLLVMPPLGQAPKLQVPDILGLDCPIEAICFMVLCVLVHA